MAKIRVLPDHVANQIAAGEVVERPASVLKELVENALDAGATRLEVRWEEGGKRLLELADDGCGMARDDLYMALERHATSKVRAAGDLDHLATFGFRGEALPSIASVSRFDMASAEADGAGHRLRCEFGVIKEVLPAARARGTTITVRDLFAQLPARRRFLKATETEHAHLWGVVTRLALATPDVHWVVESDRSGRLVLPRVAEPGERLGPLLGDKLASLVAFRDGQAPWTLRGYVSDPALSFRDRNHLYLFVNGRAVRDRLLLAALAGAWEGFFPKGAYPAAVLFLDVPPEAVDVNVHPTKAEVRFREPQRIFPWVGRALREAWSGLRGGLASVLDLPPKPLEPELDKPLAPVAASHPHLWEPYRPAEGAVRALETAFGPGTSAPMAAEPRPAAPQGPPPPPAAPASFRYLGAFDATYLLAEVAGDGEPELWIVDQHVAHERILYEMLFLRKHAPAIQPLMPPQVVGLGPAAVARLTPFLDEFTAVGLEVEPFGADALVVRGLPDFLADRDPEALLTDLLRRLEEGGRPDLDAFRRDLNAELACRSAIKKHHVLPAELAQCLLEDLMACQVPHTCPHGRPVIKKLTRGDLERSFGRRL
ncbi:DNA mismatch repair endonuclease MutL [Mesoterricola sediminis]|uniref:DNA mismatch repair protein MutL n=1 Tax=Mesoterricola sediminis TaxID=2927980 RepID=A0AA48GT73_9BACT|nr:DNA mismatch repair endonuclease MutL [Mesoterricola sediminis]BDU75220.1 DNA mismatch repair protein MutL [Mesoterricola sediminis]